MAKLEIEEVVDEVLELIGVATQREVSGITKETKVSTLLLDQAKFESILAGIETLMVVSLPKEQCNLVKFDTVNDIALMAYNAQI